MADDGGLSAPLTLRGGDQLRDTIARLSRVFRAASIGTAELDARILALHACDLSLEAYSLDPRQCIDAVQAERIESWMRRRLSLEPVSRIIGRREFWGLEFRIDPAVLDPRPDTETLVAAALDILRMADMLDRPLRIADLGTGSGCILLAVLSELPKAYGVGIDIDPRAASMARENAGRLGLSGCASFFTGRWADALSGDFFLTLANPPYIVRDSIKSLQAEVRLHDPETALDGGPDGLNAYREIADSCAGLASDWYLLEAGAGQAGEIAEIFTSGRWGKAAEIKGIYKDINQIDRVVALKRQIER